MQMSEVWVNDGKRGLSRGARAAWLQCHKNTAATPSLAGGLADWTMSAWQKPHT